MIVVYVSRPKIDLALPRGEGQVVLVDGKPIGRLRFGEYLAVEVEPGAHMVSDQRSTLLGQDSSRKERTTVERGATAFFEVTMDDVIARAPTAGEDAIASQRLARRDPEPAAGALGNEKAPPQPVQQKP